MTNDLLQILKLSGLQEQAMMQVTPPGTPKPPAMQPQLNLPQTQAQMAPTAMGTSPTAVPGSNVKQPGTMEEELHGDQHELDVDHDGEIEGSDLAKLRAGVREDGYNEFTAPDYSNNGFIAPDYDTQAAQNRQQAQAAPKYDPVATQKVVSAAELSAAQARNVAAQASQQSQEIQKKFPQAFKFGGMKEDGVEEGNEFTEKLRKTPKGEKFRIGDKIYTDTSNLEESQQLEECGDMGPMANGMSNSQESRMNVSTNMSSDGTKTVTVTADGEAAEELMQLLSLAGMKQSDDAHVYMESIKPFPKPDGSETPPEKDTQPTKPPVKDTKPTRPPVKDTQPTKPPVKDTKPTKPPVKDVTEAKDSRYEASTTPDEKVIPLEAQLRGGDGEVAGKTKKMTAHGYKHSDNNLAMKENQVTESKTLSFLKEYESLLLKKKLSESYCPRAQDRFGIELGDLLIETNVLGVTKDGIVLETDTWAYDHLNKLGYISKELTESIIISEGEQTVNIEDQDTGDRINVIVNYSYDDGEIVFDEVEVVNNPEKQLSNSELNEVYNSLIEILQQAAEPDYYSDDDDRIDPRQREYYSNFPMNYAGTKDTMEAKYQGREVPLGKPMAGDVAKSKVYVRGPKGNVVKVNFGDKNMRIKKSNPKRRKSFRARHNCANPGPRWKARYWSCRAW